MTYQVNRFSWHKQHGDYADLFLRKKYFPKMGYKFRRIRKDKFGLKPEGWLLKNDERIALVEIKLIRYQTKPDGLVHNVNLRKSFGVAISKAKKQLKTIKTDLPRIIYFVVDDPLADARVAFDAIFGPQIIIVREGKTIYNGPRGFSPRQAMYKQDNKFKDNLLTAVICYKPKIDGHSVFIFENKAAKPLPIKLIDKKNLTDHWQYDPKKALLKKIHK